MKITTEIIDKLANLAKLRFSDDEKIAVQQDMEQMVGFINKLEEVNTEGLEPLMHMGYNENALRDDKADAQLKNNEALKNAPVTENDFFAVPKVIQK